MTDSYTISDSESFTVTHARHIAAKVATDLKRIQRLYGSPGDASIADYEAEVIEFMKADYLGTLWYGYRRNGNWIEPTLRYTARDLFGSAANDDDPGRVRPGADISDAKFYSYLTYGGTWSKATEAEKQAFRAKLPFQRGNAPEPGLSGYMNDDRIYSTGGRALNRASMGGY